MAETVREFRPRERRGGNALKPFPLPEVLQKMLDRGKAEMAAPFKGVTTNGEPIRASSRSRKPASRCSRWSRRHSFS